MTPRNTHTIMNIIIRITAAAAATGLLVGLAGTSASAAPSPEDTYLIVADNSGASAMSATTIESTVEKAGGEDVTTYDNIGAATAEMTATEAQALDAQPGLIVAKDEKITATDLGDKKPMTAAEAEGTIAPIGDISGNAVATSWGLDRIDQRPAAVDGQYNTPTGNNGAGAHVYIFDTGIAVNHPEFAGRIGQSWDMTGDGDGVNDHDGHGTHVAGTIGSNKFGVAPGATLHAVQVLDGTGTGYWSWFLNGLNTVAASNPPAASVANASMGGGYNSAVNQAVTNFITNTGMPFAVAAGNEADDASLHSPASVTSATTVAASTQGFGVFDYDASYSNYGTVVDTYAPGTDIWSTYYADPTKKMKLSGTSMATPHVAGYYALYYAANPNASIYQGQQALIGQATNGTLDRTYGGTPNRMLYTSANTITTPPPTTPPAGQVPSAPGVQPVYLDHDSFEMYWSAPDARNGTVDAFRFGYTSAAGNWSGTYAWANGIQDPFVFAGLRPNTDYTVWVQAHNGNGWGPKAAVAVHTKQPPLTATVSAVSRQGKFKINVNPDRPGKQYYKFTLQKWNGHGWVNVGTYRTKGKGETKTINKGKGTYRAVVQGKYGYRGVTTGSVYLKK